MAVEAPATANEIEPVSSDVVATGLPIVEIVDGVIVDAVAEVDELAHRSIVLVTFSSGAVGLVKSAV